MSDFLDWSKSNMAAEPQSPAPWEEDSASTMKMKHQEEEKMVTSAHQEPSTLCWPEDRNTEREPLLHNKKSDRTPQGEGLEAERRSLLSEGGGGASRTESQRELGGARELGSSHSGAGANGSTGAGLWEEEEPELRRRRQADKEEVEIEVEEDRENRLPDKAAQVFNPAVTILTSPGCDPASPRESEAFWELEAEKSPFLGPNGMLGNEGFYNDWPLEGEASRCRGCCCTRDVLKLSVSVFSSVLLFPFLVWGGYVFLPFDAPLLPSTPLRLVYTLRCSVFATVPILLGWVVLGYHNYILVYISTYSMCISSPGWVVLGVSRLRSGAGPPPCEHVGGASAEGGGAWREAELHRRYVSDSLSLFMVYFLQLAVMSPYLSQSQLKLIPLLTILFTLGRLVYWVAAAFNSSVRGFGFGLSFLPTLSMLGVNLYFIFTMEAGSSMYVQDGEHLHPTPPPDSRQRFWG